MITWFGFENVKYMIALLIGISIHIWRSERHNYFSVRLSVCLAACILIAYLCPVFTGKYVLFNGFIHLFLFACTIVASIICFKLAWFYIMNRCSFGLLTYCSGYVWVVLIMETFSIPEELTFTTELICFFLVYLVFWLFSLRENSPKESHFNNWFKIIVTNLLVVISLMIVGQESASQEVYVTRTVLNFIIIYLILWLLNIFSEEKRVQDDYKMVKQLMVKEEQQYEMSKEYIDLINVKCHDLKHQIFCMREGNIDYEYLKDIETIVNNFDADVKTGNDALDIVLTEKSRYCLQRGIEFTCIADGEKMYFISSSNIYSLIGNILDNAIEAVESVKEKEKRIIDLKIREEAGVLHIRAENYCEHEVKMKNGLPLTTKKDESMHGFGVKSIQIIAEKYKGIANFFMRGNLFVLDVLLPFQSE